jgi:hypothetical protein
LNARTLIVQKLQKDATLRIKIDNPDNNIGA